MHYYRHKAELPLVAAWALVTLIASTASAVGQEPTRPEILLNNADQYYVIATDKKMRGEEDPTADYREAARYYARYLVADPGIPLVDSARVYFNLADSYMALADYEQASQCLNWLIDRSPENVDLPTCYAMLGFTTWNIRGIEEALPYYLRYVEARPGDAVQRKPLALGLVSLGRIEEALPHLLALLANGPEDEDIVRSLLHVREKLPGDFEAITLGLIKARPETPIYILDLGISYMEQVKLPEAVDSLNRYLELRPEDVAGWEQLAEACRRLGDTERAMVALRRIIEIENEHIPARCAISALYLEEGLVDEAVMEATAALELDSDDSYANAVMGDAAQAWAMRLLREEYPNRSLENMPVNIRLLLQKTVCDIYYARALASGEWRKHAEAQIQYLSQFFATSADIFMEKGKARTPITFPPPGTGDKTVGVTDR